jgi:hypothetical protein
MVSWIAVAGSSNVRTSKTSVRAWPALPPGRERSRGPEVGGDARFATVASRPLEVFQGVQRRPLHGPPRSLLPGGTAEAGDGVHEAGGVERCPSAVVAVPGELQIESLPGHPDRNVADALLRFEPGPEHAGFGHRLGQEGGH